MKMDTHANIYGRQQKHSKREAYNDTGLPQDTHLNISNKRIFQLKELDKEEETIQKFM